MSWFNPQALQSIASKVQEYAENALVLEEDEQQHMEDHPLSDTQEFVTRIQEQNSKLKEEVMKLCSDG